MMNKKHTLLTPLLLILAGSIAIALLNPDKTPALEVPVVSEVTPVPEQTVIVPATTSAQSKSTSTATLSPVLKPAYVQVVVGPIITKGNVIGSVNNERIRLGLVPLQENARLSAAAEAKMDDMLTQGYFDHFKRNGELPWIFFKQAGYDFKRAGENLAEGYQTTQEMTDAWIGSPKHFANISTADFTETGVAVRSGLYVNITGKSNELDGKQVTFVVQFFGRPLN